jgi:CO/xanthine dehydrogenase FAD-binding subunit
LTGRPIDVSTPADTAQIATDKLETQSDLHASADYRREVTRVLIERTLARLAFEGARS